jgi:hypothetical protein
VTVVDRIRTLLAMGDDVAMMVLWEALREIQCVRWGTFDPKDEQRDPDAEMLDILRALPMDGMSVEMVMAALAMTNDYTEALKSERKRLAAWVVEQLRGWA